MQILFASSDIEEICKNETKAVRKLGSICCKKLKIYLSVLQAAQRVSDLPKIGRLHDLTGDRDGQKAFWLDKKMRLVFAPGNEPVPFKEDGGINWTAVTIVRIEYIGNYHD